MADTDVLSLKTKTAMVGFVSVAWLFALAIPPWMFGLLQQPGWKMWTLMTLLYAYLGYTGMRAYHRGWRSRFILRVIVPLSLLGASALGCAVTLWSGASP